MAKIPVFRQQVQEQSLQGGEVSTQASAEAFGAGEARDAQSLGRGVQVLGQGLQRREDINNINTVRDADRKRRLDTLEESTVILNKQGELAKNAPEEMKEAHKRIKDVHATDLTPDQKKMYDRLAEEDEFRDSSRAVRHSIRQAEVAQVQSRDADSASWVQTAVADEGRLTEAESMIKSNTAANNAGNKKLSKLRVAQGVDDLYSKVLSTKIDDDPRGAREFLKKNKDKFLPTNYGQLEEKLSRVNKYEDIRSSTISIIEDNPGDLSGQLKASDKLKDPQVAKAVRSELKMRDSEQQLIAKRVYDQKMENERDKIDANPQLYKINPSDFNSNGDAQKLRNYQNMVIRYQLDPNGSGRTQEQAMYANLMALSPSELNKVDLMGSDAKGRSYSQYMSKNLFDDVSRQKKKANTVDTQAYKFAKDALRGNDDFTQKDGEEESLLYNQFMTEFNSAYKNLPVDERTPGNINKLIYGELLAPATVEDGGLAWLDKEVYRFQMSYLEDSEERLETLETEVPQSLKQYGDMVQFNKKNQTYYFDRMGKRAIYDKYGTFVRNDDVIKVAKQ